MSAHPHRAGPLCALIQYSLIASYIGRTLCPRPRAHRFYKFGSGQSINRRCHGGPIPDVRALLEAATLRFLGLLDRAERGAPKKAAQPARNKKPFVRTFSFRKGTPTLSFPKKTIEKEDFSPSLAVPPARSIQQLARPVSQVPAGPSLISGPHGVKKRSPGRPLTGNPPRDHQPERRSRRPRARLRHSRSLSLAEPSSRAG